MSVALYVEGGGDSKALKTACRRGFSKFIENAGLAGRMPRIVACGSRENAYDDFKTAHVAGDSAMLLVDAEGPVTASGPWRHLKATDGWDPPAAASDQKCHLMVEIMKSWFLADVRALESFYGQGFRTQRLPKNPNVEQVSKQDVLDRLAQAARDTKKGGYRKSDSFHALEQLCPDKVRKASLYANRLIQALA